MGSKILAIFGKIQREFSNTNVLMNVFFVYERHSVLSSVAKPERKYPFGFGNVRYTYALMSAQIMVGLGGVAIWQGIVGLAHPEPIKHVGLGVAMCLVASGLEMYSV